MSSRDEKGEGRSRRELIPILIRYTKKGGFSVIIMEILCYYNH